LGLERLIGREDPKKRRVRLFGGGKDQDLLGLELLAFVSGPEEPGVIVLLETCAIRTFFGLL
jgi:hypothetical protein